MRAACLALLVLVVSGVPVPQSPGKKATKEAPLITEIASEGNHSTVSFAQAEPDGPYVKPNRNKWVNCQPPFPERLPPAPEKTYLDSGPNPLWPPKPYDNSRHPYPPGGDFHPSAPDVDPMITKTDKLNMMPKELCDLKGVITCDKCYEEVKKMHFYCNRGVNYDDLGTFCDSTADRELAAETHLACKFVTAKIEDIACPEPCQMLRSKLVLDAADYVCHHNLVQCVGPVIVPTPTPPIPVPPKILPVCEAEPVQCAPCKKVGRAALEWCKTSKDISDLDGFCEDKYKGDDFMVNQCKCAMARAKESYFPDHPCQHLSCPAMESTAAFCDTVKCKLMLHQSRPEKTDKVGHVEAGAAGPAGTPSRGGGEQQQGKVQK